jgi:hypothetical protein
LISWSLSVAILHFFPSFLSTSLVFSQG